MSSIENASGSGLSVKDVDEIEMVSQKINQLQEIKRNVEESSQDADLDDVMKAADEILDQLNEGHNEIKEKMDRIEKLDETVKQLESIPKSYVLIISLYFTNSFVF